MGNVSMSQSSIYDRENQRQYPQVLCTPPIKKNSWKNLFSYIGPGFLISIAYIDPGNFETDLQAGAQYKYELLWIILVAACAALIFQSLAARLGVVTGKYLAEHCRAEYLKVTNFVLWILAELADVASDIPEGCGLLFALIGTAFALNILFRIPVWCGVLITGLSTLMLLLLQQYGGPEAGISDCISGCQHMQIIMIFVCYVVFEGMLPVSPWMPPADTFVFNEATSGDGL